MAYYRPIAQRLIDYRHRREDLVDLLADVLYDTGVSFPLTDLGEELIDIDPLTFFAAFNRKMNRTSRQRLLRHICSELGIPEPEIRSNPRTDQRSDSELSSESGSELGSNLKPESDRIDFTGTPAIPQYKSRFFSKRQSQHLEIDLFWQLFELLLVIDASAGDDEELRQNLGALLKDITTLNPSARDKLQWAFCWLCPDSYLSLIQLQYNSGNAGKASSVSKADSSIKPDDTGNASKGGKAQYPTAEFSQALLDASNQELPKINRQAFISLVENYVTSSEQFADGQIAKWLAVKHFSENFNLDSSDFAAMLSGALTDDNCLLENTNNFYPYTEIIRLVSLEPESVRDAFCDLLDEDDNLPARCLRFCNAITILHERYRDRFAHWQIKPCAHANFFVASIYLFMYNPGRYFLYSPARAQMLSSTVGYRETFRPTDADVVEVYAEMCEKLIDCLAEKSDIIAATKTNLESRTGFSDASNHLLLDSIITSCFGI